MRFTINKDEFLKTLNIVSRPVPAKSIVPSYVFIKVVLDDRGLNLTGSNETIAISTTIPFMKDDKEIIRNFKNGAILIQGKYLTEIVRKLSGNELTLEVLDNSIVEITDEKSSFQLNSAQAEEYPEYDFNEPGDEFSVKASDLIALVDQTSFAAAIKENRPMLTALNLTYQNNSLIAVALDCARFARKSINVDKDLHFVVNVPAKTINEIVRMFEDAKNINVVVNDRKIFFKFNNTIIASNLLNGDYPNVSNIVPKEFKYSLEVNTIEFISAIERISLLCNEKSTIRMIMTPDEVEISSTTSEVGSANEKLSTFNFNGDRLEMLFNSRYVVDAIKALKSDDAILQFVAEMKPFVIKNSSDDSYIQLITPVRA